MDLDQVIGRYRIIRELGRGAFGKAYLAEDSVVGTQVVLKVAAEDHADKLGDPDEFLRTELRSSRTIASAHIARVFDVGRHEKSFYLVREFVAGPSLREILEGSGQIPLQKTLHVVKGLVQGLAAAHQSGIIHRDLKPSNVILRGGKYESPVLLDFGAAGVLDRRTGLTQAGQIFGTLSYMSPEQVTGRPQSAATDIYGLGVLFYEMLYGHTPFRGDGGFSVIREIIEGPLIFPDQPAAPAAVRQLLSRCLERDPALRPQTVEQLITAIDSIDPFASDLISQPVGPRMRQVSPPTIQASRSLTHSGLIYAGIAALSLALVLCLRILPARAAGSTSLLWIIAGVVIAAAGLPLGFAVQKWLSKKKGGVEQKAAQLLFGARTRKELTETLAIEVDKLVQHLERLDERIVGLSIAIMVDEFRKARKAESRQKALMQMMELMEKIRYRLTPWYVRHDKLIAIVVSALTCATGIATAVSNIIKPPAHP